MSKLLLTSLLLFTLGHLKVSAQTGSIEPLTANADLWKSGLRQVKEKFPNIDWKATGEKNLFVHGRKGITFWNHPVRKIELKLSDDKKLVQSLQIEVFSKAQAVKISEEAFRSEFVKWQDLVSKKLKMESKEMPSIQVNGNDYSRIAWDGNRSTIVLAVISNSKGKKIVLICHERNHGLARLLLEGKQEIAATSDTAGKPDNNTSESDNLKGISRATTRSLQKHFKIKENFDSEWPKLVKMESPEITIIKESEEEKVFIYHSPNYEFVCDVKISKNVIKNFSTLFEATRLYCQEMPISMVRAQMPEGTVKFKILLFGTKASYFKNGGPKGSAGVYMSGKGVIMVPLSSLGVKKVGSSFMFDYKVSNKTLPHEITHQLTNMEYFNPGARGWFSEGLAEYVAATAYRSGKFMVNGNLNDIRSYVTEGSRKDGRGRYLGDEFSAPDLRQYMSMSYGAFLANGNFNYGLGALITYYFLHMENDGDRKNINAFLTALNDGKKGEEALKVLLAGRSFNELEKDISKAWRTRGVKITFK